MQLRSGVAILLLGSILALFVTGIAGSLGPAHAESRSPGEEIFAVRPLRLEEDGTWIGNAICYSPYRDGQRPGGATPTPAQLREDLRLMLPHWKLLRTYGASGFAENLLELIRADDLEMKVMLGVWIASEDTALNRREVDAAVRLANAFPKIVLAVCVSNETQVSWSHNRIPAGELIEYVRHVRARVAAPVTVADDLKYWNKPESRKVAAEIDFITLHAHPLWNGILLPDALSWLQEQVEAVQAMHPEREIVLGETGWATAYSDEGEQGALIKGQTGESEQKLFYQATRRWAETKKLPIFTFEAFDENWKGGTDPTEVEKHWGLFRADRSAKMALR